MSSPATTAAPPWLAASTVALRPAHEQDRMPHALLIHEAPGAGGEWLAAFAAALVLCERGAAGPCAECRACRRVAAGAHPDVSWLRPQEDSRQVRIEQVRELSAELALTSHGGGYKVGIITPADALNRFAANALLKTLEEPPEHLILILTAENAYDLLPTIRSRAVPFRFAPLATEDMRAFAAERKLDNATRRVSLAAGSPGTAVSLDLEAYEKRRAAMLVLLEAAAGVSPFGAWIPCSETIGRSKNEKLELYLKVLYDLLRDLLILREGAGAIRNDDARAKLEALAKQVSFSWIRTAVKKVDDLADLLRRNIQKTIALDDLILELRAA